MGISGTEDENTGGVDGTKALDSSAKTNDANAEEDAVGSSFVDIGSAKNGVDNSAASDGAGELEEQPNKASEGVAPLTNGTAGDIS